MRRVLRWLIGLGLLGAAAGWFLTAPAALDARFDALPAGEASAGALVFAAAGCASCHAAPGAKGDAKLVLAGGLAFASDFGTFYAPNISAHPEAGIGSWSLPDFARAVTKGVSPAGQHYYPAFPYSAYQHMTPGDVADLFAYLHSLPADETPSRAHDVGFPFNIRRTLGGWKLLFMKDDFVLTGDLPDEVQRGRYLVEGLAHCGECHTARNALGGPKRDEWLAGAPNPAGKGRIPNITPGALQWSQADLIDYFKTGFTPDYDSAGGEMAEVIENLGQLPQSDLAAIAAYLKAVPARP
jgi:mono/diheme cytochrome c family protein